MTTAEQRVKELGLDLPPPPGAAGNYVGGVQTGTLLFLSGCGPRRGDGSYVLGKLGADLDVAQGYEAARFAGLAMLARIASSSVRSIAWPASSKRWVWSTPRPISPNSPR